MSIKKILSNIGCEALGVLQPPFSNIGKSILRSIFNLDDNFKEEQLYKALQNATPEQILQIKKADHDFKMKMAKLNINLANIDNEKLNFVKKINSKNKDHMPMILAFLVAFIFFGLLISVLFFQVNNTTILNIFIGALGTSWMAIINYYFGSSLGSYKKNDYLFGYKNEFSDK